MTTDNICDRIIKARGEGASIVRIEATLFVGSPEEAARMLGLGEGAVHREIPETEARAVLRAVLLEDMAYSDLVMSEAEASDLANTFVMSVCGQGARYFTNAAWGPPNKMSRNGNLGMGGWCPATPSTFDSGILVMTATKIGCAWFMDED